MTESIHPAASGHLPSFITAPGEIDVAHGYNGHNPAVVRADGRCLVLSVAFFYPKALRIRSCSLRSSVC